MAKSKLLADLKELETYVQSCNKIDILNATNKHIKAAIAISKALQTQSEEKILAVKRKVSPNENHKTQQKFFSTKKSRNASTSALSKPSFMEVENCLIELKQKEAMVCGNCLKENDINHSNQVIQWIQCDTCSM